MKKLKFILYSFLMTLALWAVVSWPLPIHTLSGIPASSHKTEQNNVRTMIAGDHLQFLYHMWLARDTFLGHTPLFYNLYEFNRGNTEERRDSSMRYYLPFSLFYTVFANGGQAFGWNATGFASLWLTLIFTWLLAKRYTSNPLASGLAAILSIILPYRWITMLGGSPTGLAMMWIPITFYGLDRMVRDKQWAGAALAGASVFLAGWSDPHVAFFAALGTPCWCLIAYLFNRINILPDITEIKSLLRAAIPLFVFAVIIIFQAKGVKSGLSDTEVSDSARRISEIALFSPHFSGMYAWHSNGTDEFVYVGWFMSALIITCMLSLLIKVLKRESNSFNMLLPATLLLCGMGAVLFLSVGINNPGGAMFWLRLCRALPPYGMIRQPAKIFIILPTLIAIFTAITIPCLMDFLRLKGKTKFAYLAIVIMLMFDYGRRINPTICSLDAQQGAYKAIADDSRSHDKDPYALGIPLWPGDSHWSSLNQYYSTLYHVRMVNGYRPTRRQTYFEDIFMRFESFNDGSFSDRQLKTLKDRDINYIVLHEDAFPEKVSAFPVGAVLHSLLAHPMIKLLKQDGPVWAFKITNSMDGVYTNTPNMDYFFPARLWQAEYGVATNAQIMANEDTSAGKFLHLPDTNSFIVFNAFHASSRPNLCYMVRTKGTEGTGTYSAVLLVNNELSQTILETQKEWSWQRIPIHVASDFPEIQLRIDPISQSIDVDAALLTAGEWNPNSLTNTLILPATAFFHAGYTDLDSGEVVLSPNREPADVIFYGPKLPLPLGTYKISLEYSTDAKAGTILGSLQPRYAYDGLDASPIIAGQPAELVCIHPTNLRFALDVKFTRNGVLRIKNVKIESVKVETE